VLGSLEKTLKILLLVFSSFIGVALALKNELIDIILAIELSIIR